MARRHNHYERAFEDFLRVNTIPYVAVDEAKRGLLPDIEIKNADFIVHAAGGVNLIVDVKGKRFPYEHHGHRTYYESWIHCEDLEGLSTWERLFGEGFTALLVFVYWIRNLSDRHVDGDLFSTLHRCRGRDYALTAVSCADFSRRFRGRSRRWKAIDMAAKEFKGILKPFATFVEPDGGPVPSGSVEEKPKCKGS